MMSKLSLKSVLEAIDPKAIDRTLQPYQSVEKSLPLAGQAYVQKLKTALKQAGGTSRLTAADVKKILGGQGAAEAPPPEASSAGQPPIDYSTTPLDKPKEKDGGIPSLASLAKQAKQQAPQPSSDKPRVRGPQLPDVEPQDQEPFTGHGPEWQMPPEKPSAAGPTVAAPSNMSHNTSVQLHPSAVANPSQAVTMDPRLGKGGPRAAPAPVNMNPADPTANQTGPNSPANLARIRQNLLRRNQ